MIIIAASIAMAGGISLYYGQMKMPTLSPPSESGQQQVTTPNEGKPNATSGGSTSNSANIISISSPYAKEFKLPKDSWPNGIVVDSKGTVWTVGSKSYSLISIAPAEGSGSSSSSGSGDIKSYPLPGSNGSAAATTSDASSSPLMVWTMLADSKDGSIIFPGFGQSPVLRFDQKTGVFQSTSLPSAPPMQMKADKGGNIWYTLQGGAIGALQELGPRGSHIYDSQELGLGKDSFPAGLFVQNQTLWVTKELEGKIALFQISYGGDDGRTIQNLTKIAELPAEQQQGTTLVSPTDIIVTNNGSIWLTEHETSFLTEYNSQTQKITRYPTALHPIQISTLPYWLAQDVNGTGVWFNEHRGNRIAFFDFANRTLTEYEVPTRNPQMGNIANVLTLAADPTNENRAWFTELTEDKIGYVDKSVPIPFDIHTSEKQIVIEKGQTATVNLALSRNPDVKLSNNNNNPITLNVSSSAVVSGVLLNATATFSQNSIDLSKVNGTLPITLELMDEGIESGQHILAISASDGVVIRTVYVEMIVK